MRYTASAAMEDRTLRDVERWKDKIEIRLDNRQVFFLFFGSALVACLLFILGVVVGKRLESRGRAAAPEIEDPLALLDRIAATPGTVDESITFPRTLIAAPAAKADKKTAKVTAPPAEAAVKVEVADKTEAKAKAEPVVKVEPVIKAEPVVKVEPVVKAEPVVAKPPVVIKAEVPVEAKPAARAVAVVEKVDAKAPAKFALQLGSFQSREEADAFMAQFSSAAPYMVTSDIPGKGRWFRVRVGKFASTDEAAKAKNDFERQHSKIAYIAPL